MNSAKSLAQNLRPRFCLPFCVVLLVMGLAAQAAVPSAEKLLPDDTLLLLTAPDCAKLRDIWKTLPQSQLWNDPAMRPFKDKFLSKWKEEFVKPLERELEVRFDDYLSLPQGQMTFAITQNGWQGKDEQPPALLLLLDTRDKSPQLKTNLANLRKKWVDAGKTIKTEKIRGLDFSVLPLSSNDVPKTLKKLLPGQSELQDSAAPDEPKKTPTKGELVIGQVESLLILGSSAKAVEKVVTHVTGGAAPALGEQAAYAANHQALFRDAPFYGWVNVKAFVDILGHKPVAKAETDSPDPFAPPSPDKLIAATGLGGLKTLAFNFQNSPDGSLFQVFIGAPEATRQGLFKILAAEAKESSPPPFVPADAVKFQRWRVDAQKAWATLEKMLNDISPQAAGVLNFVLEAANKAAREKDPDFDVKKNLIGNLGDDIISYEKAAHGGSSAELQSPPALFLLGSPNPEQLAAALKSVLATLGQQGPPTEREFLGRKIFSLPVPALPLPMADASKPAKPRTLSYAASSGYLAMSTDASLIEEYLRSSESKGKTLREASGLTEAAQRVGGPGTGLFGYENQVETMRAAFNALKTDSGSGTNSGPFAALPLALGLASPEKSFKDWLDFSLLPPYDKISKFFHFTVYAGSASVDGLMLKMFAPVPPGLRSAQKAGPAR